jgi:flavin-binding protein dodecin
VKPDEGRDPRARGVEVSSFLGVSKKSYQDALEAAVAEAVNQVGKGKYWEVARKSVRGDNPRIGEYRVWISETRP